MEEPKFQGVKLKAGEINCVKNEFTQNENKFLKTLCKSMNLDYERDSEFKKVLSFLGRLEYKTESLTSIEERACEKIKLHFKGDQNVNYNNLYSILAGGKYFGVKITLPVFDDILNDSNLKYLDLSNDIELPAKVKTINMNFKHEYKMIDGKIIKNKAILDIFDRVKKNEISVIYGHAGVGKSGICLQLIECFKAEGIPYFAMELDVNKPVNNLEEWLKSIGLPDNIPYCISSISKGRKAILLFDQVDAIHYFGNGSKIAIRICNEIINKIKVINQERDVSEQISLVFVSREYDLKYDLIVNGLNLPDKYNSDLYIEITELSDDDLRKIIGT